MAEGANQPSEKKVTCRNWLALSGVMLGAFMAVLDIQITNSSLNDISGALGSSVDEGSWISTAYLVAEIVAIGISGIMAEVFSLKRYLIFSAIGFLIFSVLCAFSTDLSMMILFRACQGLTGGALIPLAFNVILTLLPPSKQPIGLALFGMTATFGPSIGPTIGGWLTDNYGWPWIFFINVVPGLVMLAIIWFCLDEDPMDLSLLRSLDYFGIITMAIGLGSLEYVLEEGERKDWFGNPIITRFAWIAGIFITLFLIRELTAQKPFLNLNVFQHRNFTCASLIMTCLGLGLYGTVYLVPLYLTQVQHYSALEIGETLMWVGIPQLFIIPFIPKLMRLIDVRLIIGFGLVLFGTSCLMDAYMDIDFAMDQFRVSNIVRALGQPLVIVPLLSVATAGLPKNETGSASAIFNMMRNMGGSVGIATLSTLVTRREQFHSVRIGETVTLLTPQVLARISSLKSMLMGKGLDPTTAHSIALTILNGEVRTQSFIMAYSESFLVVGVILLGSCGALLFLPKPAKGQDARAAA
jgi:MFS transporter, DHA2 family, multidrug resistance protein